MELRHLRYFATVAEEKSFRRAAIRLHISQPPLSRLVKQLEEHVGVQLLDRTTKGVELTAAGAAFLQEARKALKLANDAVDKSRQAARGEFGNLEVAYFGSVIFGVIPELLGAFRDAEPRVTVRLSNLPKDRQIRALRDGWLDIGFARFYRNEPDMLTEPILKEPVVLAVSADLPLAKRASVPIAALRDEPMIVFPGSPRPSYADEVIRICSDAGFSPQVVAEAEDLVACLAMVSAAVGVAPVPASACNIRLPRVAFVKLTRPEPTSNLYCVYRRDDKRPLLASFLKAARALPLSPALAGKKAS